MRRVKICLILILFFNTCLINVEAYPRHVDPSKLTLENPNPVQLYQLYRNVFGLINSSEYVEAIELLGSAREITAPSGTQKVLDDYNELLGSLIRELNLTETGISVAYDYLRWFREDSAEEVLHGSEPHLNSANDSIVDLELNSGFLVRVLGGPSSTLLEGIESVDNMIMRLRAEISDGYTQVEVIKEAKLEGLGGTIIRLAVNNSKPLVGSKVSVVGNLLDISETGLVGKPISIFLQGKLTQEVLSGEGGFFNCILDVPYIYNKVLSVYAEYWPTKSDDFTPSVSNILQLKIGYETPEISMDLPDSVYPGQEFDVEGVIRIDASPLEGFEIDVKYFGSMRSDVSDTEGSFSVKLVTPDQASDGVVQITVFSSPQNIVGPSSKVLRVQVVREPLNLTLDRPWIVFSGLSALISGRVYSGGVPLKDCVVKVYIRDLVLVAQTGANGDFKFSKDAKIFELSSKNDFIVVAEPKEPWISPVSFSSSYLVINSIMSLLVPLTIIAYLFMKQRNTTQLLTVETGVVDTPNINSEPTGLASVYMKAVQLIASLTKLPLLPTDTLREYLRKVRPYLDRVAYSVFERVTKIYEHWLYSGSKEKPPLRTTEKMVKRLRDNLEQNSD